MIVRYNKRFWYNYYCAGHFDNGALFLVLVIPIYIILFLYFPCTLFLSVYSDGQHLLPIILKRLQ